MKLHFTRLAAVALVLVVVQTSAMAGLKASGGVKGTITSVGSSGFVLSVTGKATTSTDGSSTLDVLCNGATKFFNGTTPADPSDIKEGITVAVIGATSGPDELLASKVTIVAAAKKSK